MNLFDLYRTHGHSAYVGEPVSQLEHACQAGQLAHEANQQPEMILAAFFHDIGHLCMEAGMEQMDGYGTLRHEQIGADYLRAGGLPERVALLVEKHVDAKRYLTWKDPGYLAALSEASLVTLRWQGGPMTATEAIEFEKDPEFENFLLLRKWDEQAKIEDKPLPPLDFFEGLLQEVSAPK